MFKSIKRKIDVFVLDQVFHHLPARVVHLRRVSSQARLGELRDLELDGLAVDHLLELPGRKLVELHLEGERLLGHGLIGGVVVRAQVLVGQGFFN